MTHSYEKLYNKYIEWRKDIEAENKWQSEYGGSIPRYGSYDCGEAVVREDFSNFIGEAVSFETMLELEAEYNREFGEVER